MTREQFNLLLTKHMGEIPMEEGKIDLKNISILDLFDFIYALEANEGIVIPVEKICPENFQSTEQIFQLICDVDMSKKIS